MKRFSVILIIVTFSLCTFARECPVGAIDVTDPKNTILEKCISCMRCIGICPKGARNVDQNLWNMMSQKMAPVLGGRKENHLFL